MEDVDIECKLDEENCADFELLCWIRMSQTDILIYLSSVFKKIPWLENFVTQLKQRYQECFGPVRPHGQLVLDLSATVIPVYIIVQNTTLAIDLFHDKLKVVDEINVIAWCN